jgi:DNA end-binding protein Ku
MKAIIKQGLITIGVKLNPTIKSSYYDSGFNQFCTKCNGKVRYKKVCETEDRELQAEEITKGYVVSKEQKVIFTKEELKLLDSDNNYVIELYGFSKIPKEQLTSMFIFAIKSYYIDTADSKTSKTFEMFKEGLKREDVVGIVKLTSRNKEHCGVVVVINDILFFVELPFKDSINSFKKESYKVSEKDVEITQNYIKENINNIDLFSLENTQKQRINDIIEKKLKGEVIEVEISKSEEVVENPFAIALKIKN